MYELMVIIFLLGYLAIALEHPLKIDKAASALFIGVICWVVYIIGADSILAGNADFIADGSNKMHFINHELSHFLSHTAEILFFLMGAMTIVELIDAHDGFSIITNRIKTTNKVKLLWIVAVISFFFSAALDNLTTSIVMISLLRNLVASKKERWFFAGIVVISANAGGAWSPIGDVTTTMLWIGEQISAFNIISKLFLPSLACMIAPLAILSFTMKGEVKRPRESQFPEHRKNPTTPFERHFTFTLGVLLLLAVPVFKTVTHLPPYMGMLLSLSILWVVTEIMHRSKNTEVKSRLSVIAVLRKIDTASVLFFLGILTAVSSLQSAGHLAEVATYLQEELGNIYAINIAIGLLSAIVDNVPLVAASMGMYAVTTPEMLLANPDNTEWLGFFVEDGLFWEFLAYCAGTGGSALIIGSAAGVAVMGLEKIDFIWYLKRMSLLAIVGYLAGAGVFLLMYA